MSFHKEDHTVAIAGGVGSFVTDHPWRGLLWNLIVEPVTTANTYILTVNDDKGDMVISFDQSLAADPNNINTALEMPVRGSYTFVFSGVASDTNIRVRPIVKEPVYGGGG